MLKNNTGLVLFDAFWHHVQNVMHNSSSQLQVEVAFNSLLGDCLGHTLRVSPLKLPGQKVAKPTLQKWHNTTQEKEPHSPTRGPESTPRSFPHWSLQERCMILINIGLLYKYRGVLLNLAVLIW